MRRYNKVSSSPLVKCCHVLLRSEVAVVLCLTGNSGPLHKCCHVLLWSEVSAVIPPGRTLCRLHLAEDMLHADVNGDGVIDHIQAAHAESDTALHAVSTSRHAARGPCLAVATSGIPAHEQIWVAHICAGHRGIGIGEEVIPGADSSSEAEVSHCSRCCSLLQQPAYCVNCCGTNM